MSTTNRNDASREERLFDVITAYIEVRDQGQVTDRSQWLARYPEFAAELADFFATRERLEVLAAPQAGALAQPVGNSAEAALPPALPGSGQLGDFHLLREIGRGGMGVVYEAEQISLGRRVALKVLPFVAALDPKQLQRFQNEARAAGHLHHTHIVPVHAVGCERGVHYYAMQFVEGQTVAGVIRELRQQAGRQAAEQGQPAAVLSEVADRLLAGQLLPANPAVASDAAGVFLPSDVPAPAGACADTLAHAEPSTNARSKARRSSARSPSSACKPPRPWNTRMTRA